MSLDAPSRRTMYMHGYSQSIVQLHTLKTAVIKHPIPFARHQAQQELGLHTYIYMPAGEWFSSKASKISSSILLPSLLAACYRRTGKTEKKKRSSTLITSPPFALGHRGVVPS